MKPCVDLDWEPEANDPDDRMPLIADAVEVGDQVRLDGDPQVYLVESKSFCGNLDFFNLRGDFSYVSENCRLKKVSCDDPRLRIVKRQPVKP